MKTFYIIVPYRHTYNWFEGRAKDGAEALTLEYGLDIKFVRNTTASLGRGDDPKYPVAGDVYRVKYSDDDHEAIQQKLADVLPWAPTDEAVSEMIREYIRKSGSRHALFAETDFQ